MRTKKLTILIAFTSLLIFSVVSKIFFNDFQNGWNAYIKKDYKTAYELWLPLAYQGDSKAQFLLGFMHDLGFGVAEDDEEAVKWYQHAAEQGDSRAQLFTGFIYDFGRGVAKDNQEAFKFYQLAAKGGYLQARTKIYDLAVRNTPQALKFLIDDAENGIAEAQFVLASMYAKEQRLLQNYQEAFKFYQLAAKGGYLQARTKIYDLAVRNTPQALKFLIDDAENGIAEAQFVLASMHANGQVVPQSYQEAMKWYYRVASKQNYFLIGTDVLKLVNQNDFEEVSKITLDAKKGIVKAQYTLGMMYANGHGVLKDRSKAETWLRLAAAERHKVKTNIYNLAKKNVLQALKVLKDDAENGIAKAQLVLAWMYANGQGVPQNYQESMKWYQRLATKQGSNQEELDFYYEWRKSNTPQALKFLTNDAENGVSKAQNNLGMIYAHGQDVQQDDQRALKWYRLAAENGSYRAKYNLGVMYAKGQGAPKDEEKAIKWFRLYLEDCRGTNKYIQPSKKECLSGI